MLEATNRAHAILQQDELLGVLSREIVPDVIHGAEHAMRSCFTADPDFIGLAEKLVNQVSVELSTLVFCHRNFRLDGGIMLGLDVAPLGDKGNNAAPNLGPLVDCSKDLGFDRCTGGADQTVVRPDEQWVLALSSKGFGVVQSPRTEAAEAREPGARFDVCHGNDRERSRVFSLGIDPKGGVSDVIEVVRIQRHDDVADVADISHDAFRKPAHVFQCTSNGEITAIHEIILAIDTKYNDIVFSHATFTSSLWVKISNDTTSYLYQKHMNKYIIYLEKAAFVGALSKGLSGVASGAGYLAKHIGKGLATSAHYAVGGAYRDYAFKNLGITNPAQLAKISGSKRDIAKISSKFKSSPEFRNLPKGTFSKGTFQQSPERLASIDKFKKETLEDLRGKTNAGRMVIGGTGAAAVYGAHKVLTAPFQQSQSQQYYYQ